MIRSTPAKYSSYGMPRYWWTAIHPDVRPEPGGQRDVVGRRHPHLDREQHGRRQVTGQVAHPPHGFGHVLDRDAVLHLDEAHPARAAEDPVAAVDELPLCRRRRNELGDLRCHRRESPADPAHRAEGEVLADPLVADVGQATLRRRGVVRARGCASPGTAASPASSTARSGRRLPLCRGEVVEHVVEHLDRSHGRGGGTPARTAASPRSRCPARRGRPGRRAARPAACRRWSARRRLTR